MWHFKGGGILWHIRVRSTQNRNLSAQATFIDGLGWFLVWWFLFSRTTQKSGDFSVQSAAAAAVTAKIEKTRKNVMWYIKSRVLNGGEFKNEFIFPFKIPSDPNKGVASGARGGRGAETYIQQKIMWYIKSGVFNSRDFKNEISFPFRIPSDPNKGVARRALGGGLLIPIHNKR